jgi:glycosyltransferase involved in cell wall biosynthesis
LNTLEIILPLRNPTTVIGQTIKSLVAQTDRRFSVLLSDNYSTEGRELMTVAAAELQAAGITVRRVRPPMELGRVEHWNWAHYEATGDWLKPVFAGDWLETNYIAKLRAASLANPGCRYIYASYVLHRLDTEPETVRSIWAGRFQSAKEMERIVLRYGMQFGPPSAAAYERTAFNAIGGYPTPLPICSDSLMFCALAARFGALGLPDALCNFNIHGARFSTSLPQKRKDSFRESVTYYLMLGYGAWAQRIPFSKIAFARMLARETRHYLRGK